jgi:hypothetical protein
MDNVSDLVMLLFLIIKALKIGNVLDVLLLI